jgi:hypothetical protein
MADAGPRIPAWKRLGLALKNETQSGVTAPEPIASQIDAQHQATYDSRTGSQDDGASPIVAAVNGKPLNLGKRKHQHDAAEEDRLAAKRGKISAAETNTNETIAIDSSAPPAIEVAEVQTTIADAGPSETSRPKSGDSNYRKKKEKPKKGKKRNQEENSVKPAPAPAKANDDNQFLSPDSIAPQKTQQTLIASTEVDEQALAPAQPTHRHREASKSSVKDTSGSPSAIDRRKSVTFTPDTKTSDGSSGQDLFKNWVSEQNGVYLNFDYVDPGSPEPPAIPEAPQELPATKEKQHEEIKSKEPAAEASKPDSHTVTTPVAKPATSASATAPAVPTKGKKKDPSVYTSYLDQYYKDRQNWKFNKARQNDVVDNALNIFRIPEKHSDALLEYVQGLKGAGVIERLKGKCKSTLKELDEEEVKDKAKDMSMDDPARKAAYEEALKTRISKEEKRRKVEGDIVDLVGHPHGDGYLRRMRRGRAEALLVALGRTAPILPATPANGINPMLKNIAPVRDSKKRKRRGDISSDESSSDSSSSEESSDSDSDNDSDDSGSKNSSSSDSDSDADDKAASSGSDDSSSDDDDSD